MRQNPTKMIHDVEDGKEYVLTDRGRRVAKIVPYIEPNWVKVADVTAFLNVEIDPSWLTALKQTRVEAQMRDPFEP